VSDQERDQAVGELREQFAEGRLSHDTFLHRIDAALGARHRHQLDRLLADLPRRRAPLAGLVTGLGNQAERVRRALDRLAAQKRPERRRPAALSFPPGAARWYTIGRQAECDLLIADATVSRRHARLERAAGGWLLTDLGSTNGTRLNGWRVREPVPVRPGDRVAFGSAVYVLCAGPAEPG
jgi:hypothetical protein